jgi:hypothetical protein
MITCCIGSAQLGQGIVSGRAEMEQKCSMLWLFLHA